MSLQNNAGFTEFRPAPQNAPAQIQNVGNGHFTATPVHPNLVDSHIRDPKSQGSRLENQNQFQNGEKGQNRIDRKILNNAGTKSDKSEPQKSGGGDEVEEEYPFIELNRLFTNNSEKFEEKSSGAEDSEYIYEYIDVEDLGPIL